MRLRPHIARPCPALADLDAVIDGSFCRLCSKTVHDLDAMNARERCGLLLEARQEVCVRYRLPAAFAAAALATVVLPATAQTAPATSDATEAAPAGDASDMDIIVGGARRLTAAEQRQLRREARGEEKRERAEARAAERAH